MMQNLFLDEILYLDDIYGWWRYWRPVTYGHLGFYQELEIR